MILSISEAEFGLILVLNLILLSAKLVLAVYLGREVIGKKKRLGKLELDFLFAFFILIISLFISRIFYMTFDLFLTGLDITKYHLPQNIIIWKLGGCIVAIGLSFVIFIIDRVIFDFRFKGIPSIALLGFHVFFFLFPVDSADSFKFLSNLLFVTFIFAILIPVVFLYVGITAPEIRKTAILFVIGMSIFILGTYIINDIIVRPFEILFETSLQVFRYFPFLILKISGLIIVSYSATNLYIYNYFSNVNE